MKGLESPTGITFYSEDRAVEGDLFITLTAKHRSDFLKIFLMSFGIRF